MKTRFWMCAGAALTLLAACGGGGGDNTPPLIEGTDVPVSATASPEAWSAYVGSLAPDDRAQPLKVGKVEPPTSETAEPIDVG